MGSRSQLGLVTRFGVAGAQLVAAAALAAVAIVGHVGQRVGADQVPAGHSLVTPMGFPPAPGSPMADRRWENPKLGSGPSSGLGRVGLPHGAGLGAAAWQLLQ